MEGMRDMALAAYENFSVVDKMLYNNDFKQAIAEDDFSRYLDPFSNLEEKDVHKSLEMYKEHTKGRFDFEDFITLQYILMNQYVLECDGCSSFILGQSFFSCHECFFNSPEGKSYNLCCSCYGFKKFKDHQHSRFYDSRTLLNESKRMFDAEKIKREEIEGVMIEAAGEFMEIANSIKTESSKKFGRRVSNSDDRRDEISRRFSKLKQSPHSENELGHSDNITGKDRNEEEEDSTQSGSSKFGRRNDLLGASPSTYQTKKKH